MKRIKMSEKIIFIFLSLVFITTSIIVIITVRNKNTKNEEKEDLEVIPLTNENRFLTIESTIDKYVTSVKSKDKDTLLKILDKKFVNKNNINENNVLDLIDKYNKNCITNVRKVYQIKSYNNIYVYYVKAKLVEEKFNSFITNFVQDVYFQVTINENTLTFAISPISYEEYVSKVGDTDE